MFAKKISFSVVLLALWSVGLAQTDSTDSKPPFRPTLSLGAGMLCYMGDIGNDLQFYSPNVSRPAFELKAGSPLNDYLEASLYVVFGQMAFNEKSNTRNLNFHSRITTGGFLFTYNFHQLLKPDRVFEPYVSLGFETVEFLSKTDLYDANGERYYYWSDGTVRNIDENASNAGDAVELQRDYVYESDIRELDLDGFGRYDERTFAVPVGVGGKFNLPGGFDLRIGSTMHFTFTDYLDGVTEESVGNRKGTSGNDKFIFTRVALSYGFDLDKKKRKLKQNLLSPEEMDLLVMNEDSDGDGVKDMDDQCPATPAGVQVTTNGCPVDSDKDGVPDYMDDEPATPAGNPVDSRGVTITDEQFLLAYEMFVDSTGKFANIDESSFSTPDAPRRKSRKYVVQVGSDVEGISEDMISKILSIPDVRTLQRGDTTIYLVGSHDALPEAVRRQLNLSEQGFDGEVMLNEDGQLSTVGAEADSIRAVLAAENATEASTPGSDEVVLRVQLGAFRYPLSNDIFTQVDDLVVLKDADGLTRYYSGAYSDVNDASSHKAGMLASGFEGAFLVAFRDGKRITLQEAGAAIEKQSRNIVAPDEDINKDLIRFHVQVGAFAGNVPTDVMNFYIEIGDVVPEQGEQSIRYYHGDFATYQEAEAAKQRLIDAGLDGAFVVGSYKGNKISAEEAVRLKDQ